ncbi:MAG: peptide-methionine (R)-S-oxide reductase MsrB [Deltaproteobacteria bacterium]|nr:peptide-methionine (R)-S-oxide reductase MsrB [Deltaproteobacteria bacterium]
MSATSHPRSKKLPSLLTFLALLGLLIPAMAGCASAGGGDTRVELDPLPSRGKVVLPEEAWKDRLTEEQFKFLREGGVEHAFSGAYWDNHEEGVYRCAGCGHVVYHSRHKFDAGTGWPSFTRPIHPEAIDARYVPGFGRARVQVTCARCQSHLGYVYDGGPAPTGLRHSLNSIALVFEGEKDRQKGRWRLLASR